LNGGVPAKTEMVRGGMSEARVNTRALGGMRIHGIQAGGQQLDGGAMFGVVPKPLWERRIKADERNRIQLGMRCLLVEHPSGLVLIDTGAGNKESEKFHDIYGVENAGAGGRTLLEDGLRSLGVVPEDVFLVINTHLHFDHGGGNTFRDESGVVRPVFPRARYIVQRRDFEFATHLNERTAASYFAHNFLPVRDAGQLEFVEGEREILKGIRVIPTPGHVPGHQSVLVQHGGESAFFAGDLVPTAAHLPLPWIMGYDLEPLVTLETKRALLGRALNENWIVVFEHDWNVEWGRLEHDGKSHVVSLTA
jgi:glyoxylase-like metal-dependent hydrolase (beta-lactamase superfamily II)